MRPLKAAASALASIFTNSVAYTARELSLVPPYLSRLLWLISRNFRDLAQQSLGENAAVYACMRLLTTSVAEPPMVVCTFQDDGEVGDPIPYTHPCRQIIRSPNPFLTEYEHWELITLHLAIAGRYTGWKERNRLGEPIAIWPLRPDRVGPIYGKASEGDPILIGWSYQVPGTMRHIPIPAADVISINFPDPMGESGGLVEGLGPLQALAVEVSADNTGSQFVGSLLANYATPGIVISVKKPITSADDAKLLKEAFVTEFSGSRRGRTAVVDSDAEITQLGFNLQQLEFPGLRKVSESRIAAALGTPAILVGLLVGLESGIKATTDELRASFVEQTLVHYWRRYADAFTNNLAAEFGDNLVCTFDLDKVRALQTQANATIDRKLQAFEDGVLTINEMREVLEYEPRDDGDCYGYGIAGGRGMLTPIPAGQTVATDADATGKPPSAPPAPNGPPEAGDTLPDQAQDAPAGKSASLPALASGLEAPASSADVGRGAAEMRGAFQELMDSLEPETTHV